MLPLETNAYANCRPHHACSARASPTLTTVLEPGEASAWLRRTHNHTRKPVTTYTGTPQSGKYHWSIRAERASRFFIINTETIRSRAPTPNIYLVPIYKLNVDGNMLLADLSEIAESDRFYPPAKRLSKQVSPSTQQYTVDAVLAFVVVAIDAITSVFCLCHISNHTTTKCN